MAGYFAGSTILMADGTRKPIEDVSYGDYVKDFQGNNKIVNGVKSFNIYTTRNRQWFLLNDKFLISNACSFFGPSPDYKIYVSGTAKDSKRLIYNRRINYVINKNQIEMKFIWIDPSYESKRFSMEVGNVLIKENNQTEVITSLVDVTSTYAADNKLAYYISVDGGTAWINGYLCIFSHDIRFDFSTMQYYPNAVITLNETTDELSRVLDSTTIDYSTFPDLIWNEQDERFHPANYFIS